MNQKLVYQGPSALTHEIQKWIEDSKEYQYYLEVSWKFPMSEFTAWAEEHLTKHAHFAGFDKKGKPQESERVQWAVMSLDRLQGGDRLVGFVSPHDRTLARERFAEFITCEEPFATQFNILL